MNKISDKNDNIKINIYEKTNKFLSYVLTNRIDKTVSVTLFRGINTHLPKKIVLQPFSSTVFDVQTHYKYFEISGV